MGAAVNPEAQPLRVDVTMEEMEAQQAQAEAAEKQAQEQAADDAKRQAAGPSDREKGLEEALRISEEARKRAEQMMSVPAAVPATPPPEEPKELSKEDLAELFQRSPLEAVEYMTARATAVAERNLGRRLAPLLTGTTASAEAQARQKYPDEFELFGDEITRTVNSLTPEQRSHLSSPQYWDELVGYVRGKVGNFEKLRDHQTTKIQQRAAAEAQQNQVASAGPTIRSATRAPLPVGDHPLDATEQEIVKELARSGVLDSKNPEADYRRWRNVAR